MQPLSTALIRRPFHWGIVIVSDVKSGGDIPEVHPNALVTANDHGVIVLVRHAQDIPSFDGNFDWAESEVMVRLLPASAATRTDRREVFRGRLSVPSGRISMGDADDEVVHSAHSGLNEVVITVARDVDESDRSPDAIQIDLLPVE
ncbi:hypothetical protein [Terrabacter terrigena]|uniref:Uncharacterized protein n=1 Tax=Terrabacter terrigena TaxID=574718 RepID=A0ABW3MV06_9MICO